MSTHVIYFPGCAPIPLAHYLKALGILRLVAEDSEHGDPAATGCWDRDVFVLHGRLDRDGLLDFFLHHYQPTPILAPWNKGGGFFEGSSASAVKQVRLLESSNAGRLHHLRRGCTLARDVIRALGLIEAPEGEAKDKFIQALRGRLGDPEVAWLDAAYVLTDRGAMPPPLLGKGATDGRFEFTNNFMHCLGELMSFETGDPSAAAHALLEAALFAPPARLPLSDVPAGQFLPGMAGGANAGPGFQAESRMNPWDFVLMLEGTLLFASAAVRRLESGEQVSAAFPFFVRQAGAGYGTASRADEFTPTPQEPIGSRGEMWLPLWSRPTGLSELGTVFNEGRAQVGPRAARTGVDFARAVVSLGVDRGVVAFERLGFQVRNGRSVFATPLGRFQTRRNARADLLSDVDRWLGNLRHAAEPKTKQDKQAKQVPAAVSRALNQIESAILDLCKEGTPARLQAVLVALGQAEKTLARSLAWTTGRNEKPPVQKCAPLTGLSPRWLREADDGSVEFRLAAALASVSGTSPGSLADPSAPGAGRSPWDQGPLRVRLGRPALHRRGLARGRFRGRAQCHLRPPPHPRGTGRVLRTTRPGRLLRPLGGRGRLPRRPN